MNKLCYEEKGIDLTYARVGEKKLADVSCDWRQYFTLAS
jgi:hypothetical protein